MCGRQYLIRQVVGVSVKDQGLCVWVGCAVCGAGVGVSVVVAAAAAAAAVDVVVVVVVSNCAAPGAENRTMHVA